MFDLCLATVFISLSSGKNTAVLPLSQRIMSSLFPALESIQHQLGELIPSLARPSAGGSVGEGLLTSTAHLSQSQARLWMSP